VVLEVGNWHALSMCPAPSIQQGKGQPHNVTLTEARTTTTLELEVLHMRPSAVQSLPGGLGKQGFGGQPGEHE
jgi:hypothetical protein